MVCANVLQWAPSRVTRRGALAATAAAAAAAACPPSSRYLPPPSVSLHTHARPLLPLGPRSSWSRGPLGTPHPHYGAPWSRGRQPSPTQNTPSLFRLLLNSATDDSSSYSPHLSFALFLPPSVARRLCHATTFFLLFRLLARHNAHAGISIQYRSCWSLLLSSTIFTSP